MKLPKQERDVIINGLLPLLIDVKETTTHVRTMKGRTLIYQGVTKDKDGKQIKPGTMYVFSDEIEVSVNHRRRMLEIIDRARNQAGMEEDLSRYVVKFGKSKEAIQASINNQ